MSGVSLHQHCARTIAQERRSAPDPLPWHGVNTMICERCEREIVPGGVRCLPAYELTFIDGSKAQAVPYTADTGTCGDCGVPGGSVHHAHCDEELCPCCGGQWLVCEACGCDRAALDAD